MFTRMLGVSVCVAFASLPLFAETEKDYPKALVDYSDFKTLVEQVENHREERLVDLNTFVAMSKEPNTIILDTRSKDRYQAIHISEAKNLSFTEFTQDNLSQLIPDPNTRILIYCNNNISDEPINFASKISGPSFSRNDLTMTSSEYNKLFPLSFEISPKSRLNGLNSTNNSVINHNPEEDKTVSLALNVPTYINLYGYGYKNVYELDEMISIRDPRISFTRYGLTNQTPLNEHQYTQVSAHQNKPSNLPLRETDSVSNLAQGVNLEQSVEYPPSQQP